MSATAAVLPEKERFSTALKRRFFLRVHMFVIVGGTVAVGLLTTKILLLTHERNLAFRYGLAVIVAFAAFLGFIKLWLGYVGRAGRCADAACEEDQPRHVEGSVLRATVLPFTVVLALAITLGVYAQKRCPSATRLAEAIHCVP